MHALPPQQDAPADDAREDAAQLGHRRKRKPRRGVGKVQLLQFLPQLLWGDAAKGVFGQAIERRIEYQRKQRRHHAELQRKGDELSQERRQQPQQPLEHQHPHHQPKHHGKHPAQRHAKRAKEFHHQWGHGGNDSTRTRHPICG